MITDAGRIIRRRHGHFKLTRNSSRFLFELTKRYLAVCKRVTSRTRQNMTHKICSLVWLISILVVSPLFFFTDIEYKDPEDHSIAACIYTFPDIIVEDAISEDDLKTEILSNVKQPSERIDLIAHRLVVPIICRSRVKL